MNLKQLVTQFRSDADDRLEPFRWSQDDIRSWLNEAHAEAAVRGRLLLDDFTPGLCEITVVAGQVSYQLHPKVYEIADIRFVPATGEEGRCLDLVTREYLDLKVPRWRDAPAGMPRYAIQTEKRLRLAPSPRMAGTLKLEAYRLPLAALISSVEEPEIHEAHHTYLVHWALYRGFGQPDSEGFDPERAAQAYAVFERYFGMRPDSDLRRSTRHDEPQVTVVHSL
nr:DUF6682 family protein [Delftia acidovorans]